MTPIFYIKGSALEPIGSGMKYIVHCCNDIGAWGSGFVLAINKKWTLPNDCYIQWYNDKKHSAAIGLFQLGSVQFIPVEKDIIICNMIGQQGVRSRTNPVPIQYNAIRRCLIHVVDRIYYSMMRHHEDIHYSSSKSLEGYSIHAPRFGCGLAGGNWIEIEKIIEQEISVKNIPVTIYDL
jgi:O-acetyl-ADP-ribose deacetylase (regulator of RNase III)